MKNLVKIVNVDGKNYKEYPEIICFINPKHSSHPLKTGWLKKRFSEGLRIKLLFPENQKRPAGFIEYVPGENAWRAVSAQEYMFIHCLYVYPNKNKGRGYGSKLIEECLQDAKKSGCPGVAVVTSSGPFMADKRLFIKNGFIETEKDGSSNELLVRSFKGAPLPRFNDWKKQLLKYKGINIVYSKQCPWVARLIQEIHASGLDENIKIKELKTPAEAQKAPSLYATFNLIYDGQLLADRYVSMTRLKNILKKENIL
ncbi:GNAT family N-acetyltransferase [candidate division WOR-3 bacterium]|nr:GNAT family N-acetyltransferase [candidate division WOR-3 bacterium]